MDVYTPSQNEESSWANQMEMLKESESQETENYDENSTLTSCWADEDEDQLKQEEGSIDSTASGDPPSGPTINKDISEVETSMAQVNLDSEKVKEQNKLQEFFHSSFIKNASADSLHHQDEISIVIGSEVEAGNSLQQDVPKNAEDDQEVSLNIMQDSAAPNPEGYMTPPPTQGILPSSPCTDKNTTLYTANTLMEPEKSQLSEVSTSTLTLSLADSAIISVCTLNTTHQSNTHSPLKMSLSSPTSHPNTSHKVPQVLVSPNITKKVSHSIISPNISNFSPKVICTNPPPAVNLPLKLPTTLGNALPNMQKISRSISLPNANSGATSLMGNPLAPSSKPYLSQNVPSTNYCSTQSFVKSSMDYPPTFIQATIPPPRFPQQQVIREQYLLSSSSKDSTQLRQDIQLGNPYAPPLTESPLAHHLGSPLTPDSMAHMPTMQHKMMPILNSNLPPTLVPSIPHGTFASFPLVQGYSRSTTPNFVRPPNIGISDYPDPSNNTMNAANQFNQAMSPFNLTPQPALSPYGQNNIKMMEPPRILCPMGPSGLTPNQLYQQYHINVNMINSWYMRAMNSLNMQLKEGLGGLYDPKLIVDVQKSVASAPTLNLESLHQQTLAQQQQQQQQQQHLYLHNIVPYPQPTPLIMGPQYTLGQNIPQELNRSHTLGNLEQYSSQSTMNEVLSMRPNPSSHMQVHSEHKPNTKIQNLVNVKEKQSVGRESNKPPPLLQNPPIKPIESPSHSANPSASQYAFSSPQKALLKEPERAKTNNSSSSLTQVNQSETSEPVSRNTKLAQNFVAQESKAEKQPSHQKNYSPSSPNPKTSTASQLPTSASSKNENKKSATDDNKSTEFSSVTTSSFKSVEHHAQRTNYTTGSSNHSWSSLKNPETTSSYNPHISSHHNTFTPNKSHNHHWGSGGPQRSNSTNYEEEGRLSFHTHQRGSHRQRGSFHRNARGSSTYNNRGPPDPRFRERVYQRKENFNPKGSSSRSDERSPEDNT